MAIYLVRQDMGWRERGLGRWLAKLAALIVVAAACEGRHHSKPPSQ